MSAFNILVGNYSKSAKSICYLGIWMIVPFVVYKINLIAISVLYSNKTTPLYEALKKKLESYGIIVSEKTPVIGYRGTEIDEWLMCHPEVDKFVIFDDNRGLKPHGNHRIQTS